MELSKIRQSIISKWDILWVRTVTIVGLVASVLTIAGFVSDFVASKYVVILQRLSWLISPLPIPILVVLVFLTLMFFLARSCWKTRQRIKSRFKFEYGLAFLRTHQINSDFYMDRNFYCKKCRSKFEIIKNSTLTLKCPKQKCRFNRNQNHINLGEVIKEALPEIDTVRFNSDEKYSRTVIEMFYRLINTINS